MFVPSHYGEVFGENTTILYLEEKFSHIGIPWRNFLSDVKNGHMQMYFWIHSVVDAIEIITTIWDIGPFREGIILHSYMGSAEMVKEMAKLGAYFSFSGFITSMKVEKAKKLLKMVPCDKLLLETDAPDALPKSNFGPLYSVVAETPSDDINKMLKTAHGSTTNDAANHPSNILEVLRYVAWLLDMSVEEVAQITYKNSVNLFSFEGSKVSTES